MVSKPSLELSRAYPEIRRYVGVRARKNVFENGGTGLGLKGSQRGWIFSPPMAAHLDKPITCRCVIRLEEGENGDAA